MTTHDTRSRASGKQTVVNWGLALSTIIGALLVEAYAMMQVMGVPAVAWALLILAFIALAVTFRS